MGGTATAATTFIQANAIEDNAKALDEELTRQQEENFEIAREEKSDVIRLADQELGSLRAAAGEVGATDTAFLDAVREIGAVEGLDISRVDTERERLNATLQASKEAGAQSATDALAANFLEGTSSIANSVLGFAGTSLTLQAKNDASSSALESSKNKIE